MPQAMQVLDADAVRRFADTALDDLQAHCAELDALNVFPVPDSDTGTNLVATLRAGVEALAGAAVVTAGAALAELARAVVLGARGNSGVIVSQILTGLAAGASGDGRFGAAGLRRGLIAGARLARAAVSQPAAGTILTVADAAADDLPQEPATLAEVARCAVRRADAAARRTPAQLAVLRERGVVDAGARGLVLLLDALHRTIDPAGAKALPLSVHVPTARPAQALQAERESGSAGFEYEVQYLLDAEPAAVARLRHTLEDLGDSVAVAGTVALAGVDALAGAGELPGAEGEPAATAPGIAELAAGAPNFAQLTAGVDTAAGPPRWNVHVHVNDVGAAIEAGIQAGRPSRITVLRFADQRGLATASTGVPASVVAGPAPDPQHTALVALNPGAALAEALSGDGVTVVAAPPGAEGPLAEDLLAALRGLAAARLVVLANAEDAIGVAEQAAAIERAAGRRVAVVPTRSAVQGLAAAAVHDPARRFDDDVVAMAEAAAATRFAEVIIATRQALTSAGMCEPGDTLGLIDGEVVEVGRSVLAVSLAVLDRLLGVGVELVTVVAGRPPGAPASLPDLVVRHVRERAPLTEIVSYSGGDIPLLIGAE